MSHAQARSLRNRSTDTERHLWERLRRRQVGGHKFRRQQPLGPYVVDFVCLEKRLIVEVDGSQHLEEGERDVRRTQWLEAQGFRVLRFWDNEIWRDIDAVAEAIWRSAGDTDDPPPESSPAMGEEKR